jgi:hypothetical protein
MMFTVGAQGRYEWLVTDENFDLLQLCPEIVLGKYVAVTSMDSGQLIPTDRESALGGRVGQKLRTPRRLEMLKICRVAAGTNGTSSTLPQTSAQATLQRMSLTCHRSRDTSAHS